jgi:hypothetical protein
MDTMIQKSYYETFKSCYQLDYLIKKVKYLKLKINNCKFFTIIYTDNIS